jgi:hypothetical protein
LSKYKDCIANGEKEMKAYTYSDNVFSFEGAVSVEKGDGWVSPWRLEFEKLRLFYALEEKAHETSGIRLSFCTDSEVVEIKSWPRDTIQKIDVYVNGKCLVKHDIPVGTKRTCFKIQGTGEKEIEIYLPSNAPFWLNSISIADNASIIKIENQKKCWVHYGSHPCDKS